MLGFPYSLKKNDICIKTMYPLNSIASANKNTTKGHINIIAKSVWFSSSPTKWPMFWVTLILSAKTVRRVKHTAIAKGASD